VYRSYLRTILSAAITVKYPYMIIDVLLYTSTAPHSSPPTLLPRIHPHTLNATVDWLTILVLT